MNAVPETLRQQADQLSDAVTRPIPGAGAAGGGGQGG